MDGSTYRRSATDLQLLTNQTLVLLSMEKMPDSYSETSFALFVWRLAFDEQKFEIAMCVVESDPR